jgi:hypothetical protein
MCSASPSALSLWRTCNYWRADAYASYFPGDLRYEYYMHQLNTLSLTLVNRIRSSSRCSNLFVLDFHAITAMRPELTNDGGHYPTLIPLWGQLIANAFALWNDPTWPYD